MKSIKLVHIEDLAQDFLKPPRMSKTNNGLSILYDYEMDSGGYGEKSIFFEDVYEYRHVHEDDVMSEMIDAAYNSIAKILDSEWMSDELNKRGLKNLNI